MRKFLRRLLPLLAGICLLLAAFPAFATVAAAPQPEPTEMIPYYLVGTEMVYITATGKRYHTRDDCGQTQTAFLVSLEEACRLGYTPCGSRGCNPPDPVPADPAFALPEDAVIVYLAVGNTHYHSKPNCSGLNNAVAVTLEEALYLRKLPCTKCDPPQ